MKHNAPFCDITMKASSDNVDYSLYIRDLGPILRPHESLTEIYREMFKNHLLKNFTATICKNTMQAS